MKISHLTTGDVIYLNKGVKVYAKIKEKFIYTNRWLSDELTNAEIYIGKLYKADVEDSFIADEGEYVVFKTEKYCADQFSGYSNTNQIFCKKLKNDIYDENGQEVSFYQQGSFTCVVEDINPIRKMRMVFL
jgi:hypothetical protein